MSTQDKTQFTNCLPTLSSFDFQATLLYAAQGTNSNTEVIKTHMFEADTDLHEEEEELLLLVHIHIDVSLIHYVKPP